MVRIHKFSSRGTKRKAGEAGKAGATGRIVPETTVPSVLGEITTTDSASSAQIPDLYSTEGPTGMKVIADPPDAALDIIFVHGLTGNRDNTWAHGNGTFWPQQLADDIKIARIMTYGYDASVVKFWAKAGNNNLRNHGKNLAFAASDQRMECTERPIIFIAHSLGGLVCVQALLHCREGSEDDELGLDEVFRSTRQIIFMGTPLAGADLAKWVSMFAKALQLVCQTNPAIVEALQPDSEVLNAVQQQFQQLLRKRGVNILIHCFFEEKAVRGVGVIVPDYSATLAQYANQGIAADHINMVKFTGKNDEGYQKVSKLVQRMIKKMISSSTSM
ncbi:Protein SERAC1 [Lachnellula suecica]|uniref:Protein SERAC1 n=1 Tax=Lachnellula suecica TaxID=602035 RepID=A0A8T9CAR2_9HELO|nr:Protein SERAC1 [Lachnellula suecica]